MARKVFLIVTVTALVTLVTTSDARAWGACHVGYTHVGPSGVYHAGYTTGHSAYGGFSAGHVSGYGAYGGSYHAGGMYGHSYGGGTYGGSYHYASGGYAAGGFRSVGVYGGYHAGVYHGW